MRSLHSLLFTLISFVTANPVIDVSTNQNVGGVSFGICASQIPNFPWIAPSIGLCLGPTCSNGLALSYECTGTTTVTYASSTVTYVPVDVTPMPLTYSISGAVSSAGRPAASAAADSTQSVGLTEYETFTNSAGLPTSTSTTVRGLTVTGGTASSAATASSAESGASRTVYFGSVESWLIWGLAESMAWCFGLARLWMDCL